MVQFLGRFGNTPFLMVQAGADLFRPQQNEDNSTLGLARLNLLNNDSAAFVPQMEPLALSVDVLLSSRTFAQANHSSSDLTVKIEVFFNGVLTHSHMVSHRDAKTAAQKPLHIVFGGSRAGMLAERPWVILPPGQDADGSLRGLRRSLGPAQRWEEVAAQLRKEGEERGYNEKGMRAPTGDYLESLAGLGVPERVMGMQRAGGRKFGVVDVVVTSGRGSKRGFGESNVNGAAGASLGYVREPVRLVDLRHRPPEVVDLAGEEEEGSEGSSEESNEDLREDEDGEYVDSRRSGARKPSHSLVTPDVEMSGSRVQVDPEEHAMMETAFPSIVTRSSQRLRDRFSVNQARPSMAQEPMTPVVDPAILMPPPPAPVSGSRSAATPDVSSINDSPFTPSNSVNRRRSSGRLAAMRGSSGLVSSGGRGTAASPHQGTSARGIPTLRGGGNDISAQGTGKSGNIQFDQSSAMKQPGLVAAQCGISARGIFTVPGGRTDISSKGVGETGNVQFDSILMKRPNFVVKRVLITAGAETVVERAVKKPRLLLSPPRDGLSVGTPVLQGRGPVTPVPFGSGGSVGVNTVDNHVIPASSLSLHTPSMSNGPQPVRQLRNRRSSSSVAAAVGTPVIFDDPENLLRKQTKFNPGDFPSPNSSSESPDEPPLMTSVEYQDWKARQQQLENQVMVEDNGTGNGRVGGVDAGIGEKGHPSPPLSSDDAPVGQPRVYHVWRPMQSNVEVAMSDASSTPAAGLVSGNKIDGSAPVAHLSPPEQPSKRRVALKAPRHRRKVLDALARYYADKKIIDTSTSSNTAGTPVLPVGEPFGPDGGPFLATPVPATGTPLLPTTQVHRDGFDGPSTSGLGTPFQPQSHTALSTHIVSPFATVHQAPTNLTAHVSTPNQTILGHSLGPWFGTRVPAPQSTPIDPFRSAARFLSSTAPSRPPVRTAAPPPVRPVAPLPVRPAAPPPLSLSAASLAQRPPPPPLPPAASSTPTLPILQTSLRNTTPRTPAFNTPTTTSTPATNTSTTRKRDRRLRRDGTAAAAEIPGISPLSEDCVISYARRGIWDQGVLEGGLEDAVLRQVRSEKLGVFEEEEVLVGVRFLVAG